MHVTNASRAPSSPTRRARVVVDEARVLFGASYAVFSPCGRYRYSLVRRDGPGPLLRVVGLNPSTADALVDDPTVLRCRRRAGALGLAGLCMQNLFGLRSSDPRALVGVADPVGPGNDEWLEEPGEDIALTLVAWGSGSALVRRRAEEVLARIGADGLVCLGTTADGMPRHPLYVSYAVAPTAWSRPPSSVPSAPAAAHGHGDKDG